MKPPVNKLAGKIYQILFPVNCSVIEKNCSLQELFTFKNVLMYKIYKLVRYISERVNK